MQDAGADVDMTLRREVALKAVITHLDMYEMAFVDLFWPQSSHIDLVRLV